jgi:uncharacterized RDD family membrane protein YckC
LEAEGRVEKADVLNRSIAKCLDLLIVVTIYQIPLPVSFWIGMAYLLLSDGASGGRSVGKRLIGLRMVERGGGVSFKASIFRNLPWAAAYLLFCIPYIGILLVVLIVCVEFLLVMGSPAGLRMGDALARTQVLNDAPDSITKGTVS